MMVVVFDPVAYCVFSLTGMLEGVTSNLTTVIEWIGTVLTALTGEAGALKDLWPLLAVGISISIVMLVVRVVKSFAWGA